MVSLEEFFNAEWFIALATFFLAVAAFFSYLVARRQQHATGFPIFKEFTEKFDTDAFRQLRKRISTITYSEQESENEDIDKLLNVIEHLATASRMGAVAVRTIWASDIGDVVYLCIADSRNYIEQSHTEDATYYEDSIWLWRKMSRLTTRRTRLQQRSKFLRCIMCRRDRERHEQLLKRTRSAESELEL